VEQSTDVADLDQLIGKIRREPTRPRASPTFLVGAEASLDVEMYRTALTAQVDHLERMASTGPADGAHPSESPLTSRDP
jgi:hypothetical protein